MRGSSAPAVGCASSSPARRRGYGRVTELDAPRRFVWEATLGPARMVTPLPIEAPRDRGAGARNTLRLELTGPTSAMVGRLLGRTFASVSPPRTPVSASPR
ncbi:MAG: hypothetical protein R2734_14035 [Nocardioides sp.]